MLTSSRIMALTLMQVCLGIVPAMHLNKILQNHRSKDGSTTQLQVGLAVKDVLRSAFPCSTLLISDDSEWGSNILKSMSESFSPAGVGIFQLRERETSINLTDSHLAQIVSRARVIRASSFCVDVVLVSKDLFFMSAFAKRSLSDRLFVWATKLLLVTHLPLTQLKSLLGAHWTFAMMNVAALNLEQEAEPFRFDVYAHLPYGPAGATVQRIATWTAGEGVALLTAYPLYPEKFQNFYGAEISITALPFLPYWGIKRETVANGSKVEQYTGTDYFLLDTLARALNFTFRVLPSASWTQATELVEQRVAFMTTVYHIVLPERQKRYDFTFTYEFSFFSFSMAKPALRPRWQSLYYPLTNEVWLSILLAVVTVPVVVHVISRIWSGDSNHLERMWRARLGVVVQDFIAMLLGQSLVRETAVTSTRVLVTVWLIFAMVVGAVYRGNLTASLTLPKYPPRPETIASLVTAVDAVTMPPYGEEFRRFFQASDSDIFVKLGDIMVIGPSIIEGLLAATKGRQAQISGRRSLQQNIAEKFTDAEGKSDLYIGRETLFPGPAAWPIPHDAPYKHILDRAIMAVVEAGLYEKWAEIIIEDTRQAKKENLKAMKQQQAEQETAVVASGNDKALTLSHLQGPLYLLLLGLILGTVAFVVERVIASCCSSSQD